MLPKCPACGTVLRYRDVRYEQSFVCPSCGQLLTLSQKRILVRAWACFFISALVLYVLGLRGYPLAIGSILGWFPAILVDAILGRTLFPPKIWPDGDDGKFLTLKLKP